MHVVKWPNILQNSCGVNTARFLKCVWPFYNNMHERVKTKIRIIGAHREILQNSFITWEKMIF